MMDHELKAKWVATLRSGNYSQGRNQLRNRLNQCCCLGVLCDIVAPSHWSGANDYTGYSHAGQRMIPHREFLLHRLTRQQVDELARMNDHGKSFDVIASYIEDHI